MPKKLIYLTSFVLALSLACKGWSYASNPNPADGIIFPGTWLTLNWQPGNHAVAYDIYVGVNYNEVENGTEGTFRGNQRSTIFIIGFPGYPYPDGLVPGTTYYWRIDEVNDLHPDSPWIGDVWSFMIPPSTAYAPEPADGTEFIDPNVTLSWEPGFRSKLHTVYFGDNFAEVSNATGGRPLETTTYTPGHLESGKTYYWRVDEFDAVTTHKGDVWCFTVRPGVPVDVAGKIICVDTDAPGNNDGSSWFDAFLCLQDALAVAQYGDEIRVANGVYKPDQQVMMRRDQSQIVSSGDWTATFKLIDGLAIKGGYAGFGEPDPNARDINRNKSVLSGDLNADDSPGFTNIRDNSYQVVTTGGTQWMTILDGFTITGGNADGPFPYNHGGGIYNVEGSPTLIDCTIIGNSTTGYGGGMHNISSSDPTLINCTFRNNAADYGGGIFNDDSNPTLLNCILTINSADGGGGGGMCNYRSNPTLTNCKFIMNIAVGGGGMFNEESEPMLSDCAFNKNLSTVGNGGGIFNENGSPILLSCIFSENSAQMGSGGGMYNRSDSRPSLSNCIFTGNSAIKGGGIENIHTSLLILLNCTFNANFAEGTGGGISNIQDGRLTLVNCILWDNYHKNGIEATAQISGSAEVSYSCVQDRTSRNPWPGEGNINTNPLFVDPENGDYHLKSQAGRWDPVSHGWVIDQISSPCIDSGDQSNSVGLERFPNGNRINMGAYGGTPEASLSHGERPYPVSGKASNPNPPDGAVGIDRNIILSWSPGFDGVLHDIYLGTDFDHVSPSNFDSILVSQKQAGTNFVPGRLDYNQIYYWRIDEIDSEGNTTTGDVWTFRTVPPLEPKGRACFLPETLALTDGRLVQIRNVTASRTIGSVQEHKGTFICRDIVLDTGNTISVVDAHCFMTDSGQWIAAQNLTIALRLKTLTGTIGIKSIATRSYTGKVYNLKIQGSDQYMVGEDRVIVRDY